MLMYIRIERSQNPVEIAKSAIKHAKTNGHNVVIIDTAGRLAVDEVMMKKFQMSKMQLILMRYCLLLIQ